MLNLKFGTIIPSPATASTSTTAKSEDKEPIDNQTANRQAEAVDGRRQNQNSNSKSNNGQHRSHNRHESQQRHGSSNNHRTNNNKNNSGSNHRNNATNASQHAQGNHQNWRQNQNIQNNRTNSIGPNQPRNNGQQRFSQTNNDNWRSQKNRNSDSNSYNNNNNRDQTNNNRDQHNTNNTELQRNSNRETFASESVQRFWFQLEKRVHKSKKFELHADERDSWLATWRAAAAGASGPLQTLLIAFLHLPATKSVAPPLTVIVKVLTRVVESTRVDKSNNRDLASVFESVLDTVNIRLGNLIEGSNAEAGMGKIKRISLVN